MFRRDAQHRVRPLGHRLARGEPVLVEGGLHPRLVERLVPVHQDRRQVRGGALRGGVRALPGDRVVRDDHVRDAQHQAAAREAPDRVADDRRVAPGERGARVRQLHLRRPGVLPRHELLHQLQREREVLRRVLDAVEDVQRTARDALPEQDVRPPRGGQGGHDEQLANARDQVAADRFRLRVLRARAQAVHVSDGERALRGVVRGTRRVPPEHRDQLALAGGDQHQVVRTGEEVEVGDRGAVDDQLPAPLHEGVEPAGHLHALVDGLRVPLEPAEPVDGAAGVGGGDGDAEALDLRGLLLPEVDLEIALVLQGRVEHALRGHHPPGADLVRRPVGHEGDLVPLRLESEGELETGLSGSHDKYLAHLSRSLFGGALFGGGVEGVAHQGEQ